MSPKASAAERLRRHRAAAVASTAPAVASSPVPVPARGTAVLAAALRAALPVGAVVNEIDEGVLHASIALPRPVGFEDATVAAGHKTLLLMDTETTGLSGGVGTMPFVVGTARIDCRGDEPASASLLVLTRPGAEPAALRHFAAALCGDQCDDACLVTYNGRAYDVPLLSTRLTLHRLRPVRERLQKMAHDDLLPRTRRAFARRWPDCRLGTLEARLLRRDRGDDLPGAMAPVAWQTWLGTGQSAMLAQVASHNLADLEGMLGALPALARVQADPVAHGAAALAFTSEGSDGCSDVRGALFEYLCRNANAIRAADDVPAMRELARLARAAGDIALAKATWEALSAAGDERATEHLAKLAEHKFGDYNRALELTRRLRVRAPRSVAHRRREARLINKKGRSERSKSAHQQVPMCLERPSET